ncbi:MAG: nitrilase family protein [Bacteroidaceae bacterium]|nr:nitrilase family protein [Bacteroidaceae bacterium]
MKVQLLQLDIAWRDVDANIQRVEQMISSAEPADLYVLPEMWATGFDVSPSADTLAQAQAALTWMRDTSRRLQSPIAGTLPWAEDGKIYNRLFVTSPQGEILAQYDKRHLFAYGGEDQVYSAGAERVVVTICGVRFLLQTCYDLRFPVFSRCRGDYDAILYLANWPASRISAWTALLCARAIENQCYVFGVNRTGIGDNISYCGASVAFDERGKAVGQMDDKPGALPVEFDVEKIAAFRRKFPAWADADDFLLSEKDKK